MLPANFGLRWLAVMRWKRDHPGEPFPKRDRSDT